LEPDAEPFQYCLLTVLQQDINLLFVIPGTLLVLAMLIISALFSGSENAFFSLGPNDIQDLGSRDTRNSQTALDLLNVPDRRVAGKRLLATILLMNNFINIFIVIFSAILVDSAFDFSTIPIVGFAIQVVVITFLIVLIGEIIPKIYATQNNIQLVLFMARPIRLLQTVLKPFVILLAKSSSWIDRYIDTTQHNISLEELNQAIEISHDADEIEEKNLLKGIVNFGNITVKQIMKPRTGLFAIDSALDSTELFELIKENGFSRIPVFEESLDNIIGILYIKDLIPYLGKTDESFQWKSLLRQPFFIPEYKKLDDLLQDFQEKRVHMAIVVDEYGGTSGLVTMEDLLEEVFGEIKDEFDEEDLVYSKLDETTYLFEGKILLNDLLRLYQLDSSYFNDERGEADTLGGLITEIQQDIPSTKEVISCKEFTFTIESADNRKINRVKVEYTPEEIDEDEE
jgi:gliding motility-associated protein GldE